jgi:hypothetical protein
MDSLLEPPPRFFSLAFHTRFFPRLLRARLRGDSAPGFAGHGWLELYLLLLASLAVLALGVSGLNGGAHRWIFGVVAALGAAGFLATLILSVVRGAATPRALAGFQPWIFVFVLLLGPTAGAFIGALNHSPAQAALGALAGLVVGYLAGMAAGYLAQALGMLGGLLNGLALAGSIGLVVLDLALFFLLKT